MKFNTLSPRDKVFPEAPFLEVLKKDKSLYRVMVCQEFQRGLIPPNMLTHYRIQDIAGLDSLFIKRYSEFLAIIEGTIPGKLTVNLSKYNPQLSKLLDLLNVKYIITTSQKSIQSKNLQLAYNKEIKIYENKKVLPRAFVVSKFKVIPGEDRIIAGLKNPNFDPRNQIILEKEIGLQLSPTTGSVAKVVDYSPERITIEANMTGNGFLVLSENYYPGWKAIVDGKRAEILRTNYILRSVYLTKGKHKVMFVYKPSSFMIGLGMSILGLVIVSLIIWIEAMRKIRRNE
jgi:uncharacterized membrane protein YfhO